MTHPHGVKLRGGVEWVVHGCLVLSQAEAPVPGDGLAEFHGVSVSYLARPDWAVDRGR